MTGFDAERRRFLRASVALGFGTIASGWRGKPVLAALVGAGTERGESLGGHGHLGEQNPRLDRNGTAVPETARAWRAMGTLLEVRVQGMPAGDAVRAIGRVRTAVAELEAALTVFQPGAALARMAEEPAGRWIEGSPSLLDTLVAAGAACARTRGTFDPTVGAMMRAWGLREGSGLRPNAAFLRRWRARPGWEAIEIDVDGSRFRRHDPRLEIDLGAIGKGVAIDRAVEVLRAEGATSALVNFGGSLGALGTPVDRPEGWVVGIAHPRDSAAVWDVVHLRSGFLATSADSERFHWSAEGRRIHHILDPLSGEPAEGVVSLSVWASSAVEADVASTAWFVRFGRSKGERREEPEHPTLVLREDGPEALAGEASRWSRTLG